MDNCEIDEFKDIRPYEDQDFLNALNRLMNKKELISAFRKQLVPSLPHVFERLFDTFCHIYLKFFLRDVKSSDELHARILEQLIGYVVKNTISELTSSGSDLLSGDKHYLYISNHRDIAMDPVLIDYMLLRRGFPSFQVAFGDNLLTNPNVSDAIRVNKAFVVHRNIGPKEQIRETMLLSKYIRQTIYNKDSIWIAQREGRAKDGDDKTNPAIIKMLTLANRRSGMSFSDYINGLNIVPVSVSYEFDPCDRLKARETARRMEKALKNEKYKKRKNEDMISIVLGIKNKKGRVNVAFGTPLYSENWSDAKEVASAIDKFVLTNYKLWPCNYFAYDVMNNTDKYVKFYTKEYKERFMSRFKRIPPSTLPIVLNAYAKPVENAEKYSD